MYNEKLDRLIEMALMDGELTEKEKQVLFKNAESVGVDLDEFEMVLEAKLFEKQKNMEQEQPKTTVAAPKSDKFGDVKKCPSCAAIVTSFSAKCVDCGHEFSNIETNVSVERLFKLLTEFDNKPKKEFGYFQDDKLKAYESDQAQQKAALIKNFPITSTKEDILEFLTSAGPYVKKVKSGIASIFSSKEWSSVESHREQVIAKAWKFKCEQIIVKARFSMTEDKKALEEINRYAKEIGIK